MIPNYGINASRSMRTEIDYGSLSAIRGSNQRITAPSEHYARLSSIVSSRLAHSRRTGVGSSNAFSVLRKHAVCRIEAFISTSFRLSKQSWQTNRRPRYSPPRERLQPNRSQFSILNSFPNRCPPIAARAFPRAFEAHRSGSAPSSLSKQDWPSSCACQRTLVLGGLIFFCISG